MSEIRVICPAGQSAVRVEMTHEVFHLVKDALHDRRATMMTSLSTFLARNDTKSYDQARGELVLIRKVIDQMEGRL